MHGVTGCAMGLSGRVAQQGLTGCAMGLSDCAMGVTTSV